MAMQVVYSAGTSPLASPRNSPIPPRRYYSPSPRGSPRCSPRSSPKSTPRGVEGWRPVMPGYKPATSSSQTSVVIQRTVEVQHHVTDSDTTLKDSIPAMSRPVAIICLICNILLPGLGELKSLYDLKVPPNCALVYTWDSGRLSVSGGRFCQFDNDRNVHTSALMHHLLRHWWWID